MKLTKNQIEIMLNMQAEMNDLMGIGDEKPWREMDRPYMRAAMMETMEAIEHHGWKWWKLQEKDLPQLKMELVDVWHFALSHYMRFTSIVPKAEIVKRQLDDFCDDIYELPCDFYGDPEHRISDCKTILDKFDFFIACCALREFNASLFLSIMDDVGMTQQELFNMYIAKNVLNEFRQKNGYKTGDYVKNWNGREDNAHLEEFMNVVDSSDPDYIETIRFMLTERYKTVIKSIDECYIKRG